VIGGQDQRALPGRGSASGHTLMNVSTTMIWAVMRLYGMTRDELYDMTIDEVEWWYNGIRGRLMAEQNGV